jgi:hypothetical protein
MFTLLHTLRGGRGAWYSKLPEAPYVNQTEDVTTFQLLGARRTVEHRMQAGKER